MFSPEADLFFTDPHTRPIVPGNAGTLHLLRRDVVACLGLDPDTGDPTGHQTLWPGAMAILAGIDLLAKFHAGSDDGKVGRRFRHFVSTYFGLPADDCETLYQLRCSLLHSFGLYSRSRAGVYRFLLTAAMGPLIVRQGDESYAIDLRTLYDRFDDAIAAYRADLEARPDLQAKFRTIFTDYGAVGIGLADGKGA